MMLEHTELLSILPHRFPFVFADRILELTPGQRVVTLKNLTATEEYFQGHFPGTPVFPGALMIEAMAQAAVIIYHSGYKDDLASCHVRYFLGSVKARFHSSVGPGDTMHIEAVALKLMPTGGFIEARIQCGKTLVAECDLVFSVKREPLP